MNCVETRNVLPLFLDDGLEEREHRLVMEHLRDCEACRQEAQVLRKSWEMLGELEQLEPDPYYVSRFFAKAQEKTPRQASLLDRLKGLLVPRRAVSLAAAAGLMIAIGISISYWQHPATEDLRLAEIQWNGVDPDMVESMEMADDFEVISNLDFLSDMEVLQALDEVEAS